MTIALTLHVHCTCFARALWVGQQCRVPEGHCLCTARRGVFTLTLPLIRTVEVQEPGVFQHGLVISVRVQPDQADLGQFSQVAGYFLYREITASEDCYLDHQRLRAHAAFAVQERQHAGVQQPGVTPDAVQLLGLCEPLIYHASPCHYGTSRLTMQRVVWVVCFMRSYLSTGERSIPGVARNRPPGFLLPMPGL